MTRNHTSLLLSPLVAALALTAGIAQATPGDADGYHAGMVFTSSNAVSGNELLVYSQERNGALTLRDHLPTSGVGSGAGLGSQGAVSLSGDGRYVFVVNAGSNSLSTFEIRHQGVALVSTVDTGGLHPISVTEHDGLVYVLNDGGPGNVTGFRNLRGQLTPISRSTAPLSAAGGTAPAQVGFSDDGSELVVTEKAVDKLVSYTVQRDGRLGAPVVTASSGSTPFGFAFNRRNRLIVTEAVGGAAGASTVSSYRFSESGGAKPQLVSASVPDLQGAACWVAVTPNGKFAYVANTGSSDVSSYRIHGDGSIALIAGQAASTGAGSAPADTAVSPDGRRLFVRNGRVATISAFLVGHDGALTSLAGATGLPTTAVGLASN